jgi:uncharacterized protein (DUF924 family)
MRVPAPRIIGISTCSVILLSLALYQMSLRPFALPKTIWNPSLYKRVRDVWFADLSLTATFPGEEDTKRWFQADAEAKGAFDKVCHKQFSTALESINPSNFTLSGEDVAKPFCSELKSKDEEENTRTALSLLVLLDQIPRNLFRTKETLPLVYNHYDPIALSLIKNVLAMDPRPDLHPSLRGSAVYRQWFYMPLMHSEDVENHKLFDDLMDDVAKEIKEKNDTDALQYLQRNLRFEMLHRDIIDKFGRYPHRNEALARESTKEEIEFLSGGGNTFGVAG